MRRGWAAGLVLATACAHFDIDRNAPGHIDVMLPPRPREQAREPDRERPEPPSDPGENLLAFTFGGFGALGVGFGGDDHTVFSKRGGIELSLHRGENDRSHFEDDFFIYPLHAVGVNVGAMIQDDGAGGVEAGPIYLEAQQYDAGEGVAGGIAIDPRNGATGPQLTSFVGPLYVRASYLFGGDGAVIEIGMVWKGALTWVWSR